MPQGQSKADADGQGVKTTGAAAEPPANQRLAADAPAGGHLRSFPFARRRVPDTLLAMKIARTSLGVVLSAALQVGCSKDAPPKPAEPGVTHPVTATPVKPSSAAASTFALDADTLDRYLAYRHTMIAAAAETLRSIAHVAPDAGNVTAVTQVTGALARQQAATQAALKANRLTQEQVSAIDPMAADVQRELMLNKSLGQMQVAKSMEDQMAKMPPEMKARMQQTLTDMKAQQEGHAKMASARQRFGDANVDLLVKRSDELLKLADEGKAALSGGSATQPP